MEKINNPSLADNFLFDFEAKLHLLEAEPEKREEFLAKKINELEKYLYLRSVRESIGDEGVKDLIKDNRDLADFYEIYETSFGGEPPALSYKELQDYLQKIKNLSLIDEGDLPSEIFK